MRSGPCLVWLKDLFPRWMQSLLPSAVRDTGGVRREPVLVFGAICLFSELFGVCGGLSWG